MPPRLKLNPGEVAVPLTAAQISPVEIYITDPVHDEENEGVVSLKGKKLVFTCGLQRAIDIVFDAINSADVDSDGRRARAALERLVPAVRGAFAGKNESKESVISEMVDLLEGADENTPKYGNYYVLASGQFEGETKTLAGAIRMAKKVARLGFTPLVRQYVSKGNSHTNIDIDIPHIPIAPRKEVSSYTTLSGRMYAPSKG